MDREDSEDNEIQPRPQQPRPCSVYTNQDESLERMYRVMIGYLLDHHNILGVEGRDQSAEMTALRHRLFNAVTNCLEARCWAHLDPVLMYFKYMGNSCKYQCQWCFQIVRSSPASHQNSIASPL
ncbi:hypothetical protein PSHT_14845 [Puccinia striiformis]|uniref:Uncharacterized protein n=2 Tax=Puccinia striiformis TaxID=27350 RepID=A0A2S4UIB0_9BASI|nr:hypothetical protein PSHT_14845 [Puccinia striiformis]